ncbi:MAG: FtsQ-type POTRA domain-containing protein [Woeseiaceae bacterium]|nr:FtsQ-type POTRA domain-containing protein [Woeseiaceae bacterium]
MRHLLLLVLLLFFEPSMAQQQAGDGRVYVRYIVFQGTDRIDDEVLRRELLQLEGTFIDTVALENSRRRLERLPYVQQAAIGQRPVDGAPDQVDIVIAITDAPAREYRVGGAWSESRGFSGFGYFVNENVLGTGQRFFAQAEASDIYRAAQVAHTDRFASVNGINRTIGFSWREFDKLTVDTTDFEGDLARLTLEYGYQIAERQSIRFGLALQDVELNTGAIASSQLEDWVRQNGDPIDRVGGASTEALTAEVLLGWHQDTRDTAAFPNSGMEQQLGLRVAVPGSELEYYTLEYEADKYWSFNGGWTAHVGVDLGYGQQYGSSTTSLPPNLNWFAGGPNTVRGYRENRLGPRDSLGNPYGGNLLVSGQFELMMPLPEDWRRTTRIGFFYDVGNVYSTEDISFVDTDGISLDYGFELSELRQSVGVAARFRTPLGLLRLSYGVPLNADDDDPNRFLRDDVENFQIAIGGEF